MELSVVDIFVVSLVDDKLVASLKLDVNVDASKDAILVAAVD